MKRKITFAINSNLLLGGGGEITLLNYISSIGKESLQMHKITVLQTDYMDKQRLDLTLLSNISPKIEIIQIRNYEKSIAYDKIKGRNLKIFLYRLFAQPLLERKSIKYIKAIFSNSDVVYLFHNRFSKYIMNKKTIAVGTLHEWQPRNDSKIDRLKAWAVKNKIVWRRIDLFHSTSERLTKFLPDSKKYENFILQSGLDVHFFRPMKFYPASNVVLKILFVGRLLKCKGLIPSLEAVKSFAKGHQCEFHIVGSGELEYLFSGESFINTIYHGNISNKDLLQLYQMSDVLLFPSKCDNFGLVILEAIACGNIAILDQSMIGTFPDLEQMNLIRFCDSSPNALAEQLELAYEHLAKLRDNREKAYQYISKKYSWNTISNELFRKLDAFAEYDLLTEN